MLNTLFLTLLLVVEGQTDFKSTLLNAFIPCEQSTGFYEYRREDQRLQRHLLSGYSKHVVPPVENTTGAPTKVTIYLWPYDIMQVDVQRSSLKISGWIDMVTLVM